MRILATLASLLLAFSSTVWGAGPVLVGDLRAMGVVLANLVPMPDGGTVRSGDAVTTAPGAIALITAPSHGRLEVRSDSVARLIGDHVRLERGSLATDRMAVELGRYTVQPAGPGEAWFAVASRNGTLVVAAYHGSVLIASAGAAPLQVNDGSVAVQEQEKEQTPAAADAEPDNSIDQDQATDNEAAANTGKKKQKRKSGARAAGGSAKKSGKGSTRAAGQAPGGGWTIGSLSHAASVMALVGAGAAVAGVTGAFALSGQGPSPSTNQ
ncbi:MAG TPA: hypothetical protein VEU62_17790 [Bryobacterales bacterium]|nr:hypothetical protein [Bryobacterales bacterium]